MTVINGGGAVGSVFTRTGAVAATSGDYTAAQVTNAADKNAAGSQAFNGELATPDVSVTGLTGSVAGGRFVGFTATGSPTTGAHSIGDVAIARDGHVFVCTTAGTPGTWADAGGAAASDTVLNDPATAARNTIQPTADVVPLTLKPKASGTANIMEFYDAAGARQVFWTSVGLLRNQANTSFLDLPGGILTVASYAQILGQLYVDGGANVNIRAAGAGITVREGANAKQGVVTLVGGAAVVSNTSVTATSRIQLTAQSLGTVATPSALAVTARTAGTSFTITASAATDTSVVAYEIFETN